MGGSAESEGVVTSWRSKRRREALKLDVVLDRQLHTLAVYIEVEEESGGVQNDNTRGNLNDQAGFPKYKPDAFLHGGLWY